MTEVELLGFLAIVLGLLTFGAYVADHWPREYPGDHAHPDPATRRSGRNA